MSTDDASAVCKVCGTPYRMEDLVPTPHPWYGVGYSTGYLCRWHAARAR